jgi:hypothetical protein
MPKFHRETFVGSSQIAKIHDSFLPRYFFTMIIIKVAAKLLFSLFLDVARLLSSFAMIVCLNVISVAYLEAASQRSIDTRPLPPIPGNSFAAPQGNVAYGTASNQNLHSTSDPYDYAYINRNGSDSTASGANTTRALQGNVAHGVAPNQNLHSTTWEEHVYQPISLAKRDEESDYMHLFPASKVKEQTDSIASYTVVSSKVDSTAPSKAAVSSEVDSTVSSKVDSTVSFKVNPAVSSKVDDPFKDNSIFPTDLSELTMEHFADADPRQAQLWMLLQIQKMVQKMEKMEDLYESVYLRAPSPLVLQTTTATEQPTQTPTISADNLQPPPDPLSPITTASQPPAISEPSSPLPPIATATEQPPPATESTDLEYYYLDASSVVESEKQQPSPETKVYVEPKMPTRKEIYINLGGAQKKATYKPLLPSPPPPAIPPKTYKKISYVQVKESNPGGPAESRPRQQQKSAQQRQESQIIGDYKNVPQQEMIGKHIKFY